MHMKKRQKMRRTPYLDERERKTGGGNKLPITFLPERGVYTWGKGKKGQRRKKNGLQKKKEKKKTDGTDVSTLAGAQGIKGFYASLMRSGGSCGGGGSGTSGSSRAAAAATGAAVGADGSAAEGGGLEELCVVAALREERGMWRGALHHRAVVQHRNRVR